MAALESTVQPFPSPLPYASTMSSAAELLSPYVAAQLRGDRREALRLVMEEGVARGVPVSALALEVIQPAQQEIGRLWEVNEISVAQEHLATAISQLVVNHLYAHLPRAKPNGKMVVVACADGEQHELGARLASDFLETAGFGVRFLGASVPADALARLVVEERADAVVLSAATALGFPGLRAALHALRESAPGVPVLVGGAAFGHGLASEAQVAADAPEAIMAGRTAADLVLELEARTGLRAA